MDKKSNFKSLVSVNYKEIKRRREKLNKNCLKFYFFLFIFQKRVNLL